MRWGREPGGPDGRGWPEDPRLDPFRAAVWELRRGGELAGYLTTQVMRMRSFPALWVKREWLWFQVNWLDGRRERADEDYGPKWWVVADLETGRFDAGGDAGVFDAVCIGAPERATLWARFGPPKPGPE